MNELTERRFTPTARSETRLHQSSEGERIVGVAAVFYDARDQEGTQFELFRTSTGRALERIMPTAFDRALRDRDDVQALFNHDPNKLLGRTLSGTMRLSKNAIGLRYSIDPGNTSTARDVV